MYYECAEGYMLHGESSHECTNRGEWSGSTPVCSTRKYLVITPLISMKYLSNL